MEKYIDKHNPKKHNIMFQRNQKDFFWTLEEVEKRRAKMPKMQRFFVFWRGIWEESKQKPNMLWMEEVKAELCERANLTSEFDITDEHMKKEVTGQKN